MDKTQKILITLIIVLSAILIVSNIGKLTGQAQLQSSGAGTHKQTIKDIPATTEVTVTPKQISVGDVIEIDVKIGEDGTDGKIGIYSPGGSRVAEIQLKGCSGACTYNEGRVESLSYKTGMDWQKGEYYVSATDRGSGKEVKEYFTVG